MIEPVHDERRWRLIAFAAHSGETNMAVDEAILEAHLAGAVPPTLRLYGFDPPAISVGHTQKIPADLLEKAQARGFDVVRRPTGGRAVLHYGDLTYSFVASSADGTLSESVSAAYRQICAGLQYGFKLLGLNLELGDAHTPYRHLHDCFHATTGSDLHIGGVKIAGSAQLRRRGAVLQHGSILLDQDQRLMPELLPAGASASNGGPRHVNLFEAAGRRFSFPELQEALKAGFQSAFEAGFQTEPLTNFELGLVARLRAQYSCAPAPANRGTS